MLVLRTLGFALGTAALVAVAACAPPPAKEAPGPAYDPGAPPPHQSPPPPAAPPQPLGVDSEEDEIQTAQDAEKSLTDAEKELSGMLDGGKVEALGDGCLRSCKALGSMRRAVNRLCELTDGDERCESARGRLERSEQRVKSSGCSC